VRNIPNYFNYSGNIQVNEWTSNSETRRQVQVVVQDIVSNKASRPGGRKKPKKITAFRQLLFVHEYLKDLNGKQAAIRAGYSPKTAESQASRLLRNVKVQNLINMPR
jgi:single-stranded DNA-binding protein